MRHTFLLLISYIIRLLFYFLPESTLASRVRGFCYGFFLGRCGKNFQCSSSVRLINLENIRVGNDVYFAPGVIVNAIDTVEFGDEVMLGFNVVVVSGNHTKHGGSYRYGASRTNPILIKEGSWVGANSVILPGTEIGVGSLIGAGSVVTGAVPDSSLFAGSPAVFKKMV